MTTSTTRRFGRYRSFLFVPATRPDRVAKLATIGPDIGVVDLEDSVRPDDKTSARALVGPAVAALRAAAPDQAVTVRVNTLDSRWYADDVDAAVQADVDAVVVPKAERPDQIAALVDRAASIGRPDLAVIAGIESALGVHHAVDLARADGVAALYFGAEDYITDVGGRRTPTSHEVLHARSHVAMAARLGDVAAIDQTVLAVADAKIFLADAAVGRDLGYRGKICIHPDQVALAAQAFSPSATELEHARRIVDALDQGGAGVVVLDGRMIDHVHLTHARAVLAAGGDIEEQP